MANFLPAFIVGVFTLGASIFYCLDCIERSVLRLVFRKDVKAVKVSDIRFTHAALKRLTPLLPPSNGFVILFGTAALVSQGVLRNWDFLSILPLAVYIGLTLMIIIWGDINAAIKHVNSTSSDGDLVNVQQGVEKLVLLHHAALFTNLAVVLIEFALIISGM